MGRLKKPLLWVLVAFCLYAIFKAPDQAADTVKAGWNGLVDGLRSIGHFFDRLLA